MAIPDLNATSSTEIFVCKLIETWLYSAANSGVRCLEFRIQNTECSRIQAGLDKFTHIYLCIRRTQKDFISTAFKSLCMEAHLKSRLQSIQEVLMKIILCEFIIHPKKTWESMKHLYCTQVGNRFCCLIWHKAEFIQ